MVDSVARILALGAFGDGPVTNALLESVTLHAQPSPVLLPEESED